MNQHEPMHPAILNLIERGCQIERDAYVELKAPGAEQVNAQALRLYCASQQWTLPYSTGVQASFEQERLRHKLVKLFKGEVNAGDARFDSAVFVTTETAPTTALLLADATARQAILAVVEDGGFVEIEQTRVRVVNVGNTPAGAHLDDAQVAGLIEALLAIK